MIQTKSLPPYHYTLYQQKYYHASGISIPDDYITQHPAYGYYDGDTLIGGFILAQSTSLRTLEVFSSDHHRDKLYDIVHDLSAGDTDPIQEICCFFIDLTYRKSMHHAIWCWLSLAWKVYRFGHHTWLIFGTNSTGLARMYGIPKRSILLHTDQVRGKNTYIFIGKRVDLLWGVGEIVVDKCKKIFMKTGNNYELQLSKLRLRSTNRFHHLPFNKNQ